MYYVDQVAPSFTSLSFPNNNTEATNGLNITWSLTEFLTANSIGYYLDGGTVYHEIGSGNSGSAVANFTTGAHTLKFSANDTVANIANSSTYSVTLLKAYNVDNLTSYIATNQPHDISGVVVQLANGSTVTGEQNITIDFNILLTTNSSGAAGHINATIGGFNGTSVNWGANFTLDSNNASTTANNIANNWSARVEKIVVFNSSLDNFLLGGANSYYGRVELQNFNGSWANRSVYWFENETDMTNRTKLSACTSAGYTSAYNRTQTTGCFNITAGPTTVVYVPHFSAVAGVVDVQAPFVTANSPASSGTQTSSSFFVNSAPASTMALVSWSFTTVFSAMAVLLNWDRKRQPTCRGPWLPSLNDHTGRSHSSHEPCSS